MSDRSYDREIRDRGVVAELQVFANDSDDWILKEGVTILSLVGGTLNDVERKMEKPQQIDAAVHPDGSVTIKTFRYATNIPLKELEILVNLAKAVREKNEKPMEVPF